MRADATKRALALHFVSARHLQKTSHMVMWRYRARILLVRAWTEPLAPLRAALVQAGIDAEIERVDIEPALVAALMRTTFDVVVCDARVSTLSCDEVAARVREYGRGDTPLLSLTTLDALPGALEKLLRARLN